MIGLVSKENGLYKLHLKKVHFEARVSSHQIDDKLKFPTQANTCHASSPLPISHFQNIVIPKSAIWNFRLGHMSSKRIAQMSKLYSSFEYDNNSTCDICHLAKQRKVPYHLSNFIASHNFELFHFDIWGPLATPSIQNHKYFFTILDEHTRFVMIIIFKSKFEISSQVQNFITMVINQFHTTPKTVRSDNGPEFMLHMFYASKDILHQRSCVKNPQHSGRVEGEHQHMLNVGRSILYQSKLPKTYLSFAFQFATINRVPTPILKQQSPY